MGVSLITTVLNEEDSILPFLRSLAGQTRPPDEVVIVDGGSRDGTVERIRSFQDLTVRCVVRPSNIAEGRNIAIRLASHEIIAVTDAGCRLDPDWLERITAFDDGTDVLVGNYKPLIRNVFDACQYGFVGLFASHHDVRRFPISSRSLAFRRRVWEEIGGYPEFLDYSEDTYFHKQILRRGYRVRWVRDAFVAWEQRPTMKAVYRQYFRYMEGDGLAGMNTGRHALRFGVYGGAALLALGPWHPLALVPLAAGLGAYLYRPVSAFRRLGLYPLLGRPLVLIPALLLVIDAAKMAGYISGRIKALRRGTQPGLDGRRA